MTLQGPDDDANIDADSEADRAITDDADVDVDKTHCKIAWNLLFINSKRFCHTISVCLSLIYPSECLYLRYSAISEETELRLAIFQVGSKRIYHNHIFYRILVSLPTLYKKNLISSQYRV